MNVCRVLVTFVNVLQCKKEHALVDNYVYLFRCNHVKGCFIETSKEAFATDDPFKGKRVEHFLSDNLYAAARRETKFRCCSDALHSSESVNSSQQHEQGETHEYEEVAAGVRNSELSNMSDQDVGSSSSMTGSGICGTDSDGYLNPYLTPQSMPITFEHGPYSDLSNTATSVLHVLESQVFFKSQK
ncbi:Hypothetical predicted protein [Mytilus galloprovincialis]|uniref:Uncharacterized protein n=1 Tax=Mytilus galloprovincialis TaxID=29158 RepID=A0A8B6GIK0_MYTGA|nr:Hypothetical predicted protein [Mytilus galloprovincialis]